jgi:hypothetical protein
MLRPETVHTEVVSEARVTVRPDDEVAPDANATALFVFWPGFAKVMV